MLKRSVGCIFILFLITFANGVAAEESRYFLLLEKLNNFDRSLDLKELRLLYTRSRDYDPYNDNRGNKDEMYIALSDKQYEKAVSYAKAVLEKNCVDIDAHRVCKVAYKELKYQAQSDFHAFVEKGIIDAILSSGDGATPQTAYVVISVREEYIILNLLGLQLKRQSLTKVGNHEYDKMEVRGHSFGETSVIYFDVDIPLKWLGGSIQQSE